MEPKVMSTVAMLIGILIVFHLLTNTSEDTPIQNESEEVSMQEFPMEESPMQESEVEDFPMEEYPVEEVSEEESNVRPMQEVSEEVANDVQEMPKQETAELTFKPKEYSVTGYSGDDYSSF